MGASRGGGQASACRSPKAQRRGPRPVKPAGNTVRGRSSGVVAAAVRPGLRGLGWRYAGGTGTTTAADPVWRSIGAVQPG
jgi:hypothetical protein